VSDRTEENPESKYRRVVTAEPLREAFETTDGVVRVMVDRPALPGRLPAVLFIQGFDCASMDLPGEHPYGQFIRGLAAQGLVVMRVSTPGADAATGEGGPDLHSDLRGFEAALGKLKSYDFVDPENVFLFGHSLGGLVAPLIAEKCAVRGIAVYGTSLKPWREIIPETFAFQLPYFGLDPVQTDRIVRDVSDVVDLLLRDRKSPAEIAQNPEHGQILSEYMQHDGQGRLWGRHYRYWQQLDDFDMAAVWRRTEAFVLSMFGEFDFEVFSDLEARTIADLVYGGHPGRARYLQIDQTGHLFCRLGSMKDNVENCNFRFVADHFNFVVVLETAAWMRSVMKA